MIKKSDLINRIEELEKEKNELLKKVETYSNLDFKWAGNLGRWTWNYRTNHVTFNPLKALALGYDLSEIPEVVNYAFFTDKLHPEDYDMVMDSMKKLLIGASDVYEAEYRIQTKEGDWKWYYDRGAITETDSFGKPVLVSGIVFDISHQKNVEEQLLDQNKKLEKLAYQDGLTELFNHKTIIEKLEIEVNRAKRYQSKLAVCMFDIDDFKKVNDSYGHPQGDDVIRTIADKIRENIRCTDLAGRYGGEEFMIIFPETHICDAYLVSERIRISIEAFAFEHGIRVTISAGISDFNGQSVADLINDADERLITAKRTGKNKIILNKD